MDLPYFYVSAVLQGPVLGAVEECEDVSGINHVFQKLDHSRESNICMY